MPDTPERDANQQQGKTTGKDQSAAAPSKNITWSTARRLIADKTDAEVIPYPATPAKQVVSPVVMKCSCIDGMLV